MSRVHEQIERLTRARDEIVECLKDAPLRTGDLLERLGYSGMNFMLTQMIGDGNGEWDGSPHQLAQSDMIEDGTLVWWRDDVLDVWYGRPEQCPYQSHGDDSPICLRINTYLDEVCRLAGAVPRCDEQGNKSGIEGPLKWSAPFLTVREIHSGDGCISVNIEFRDGKGIVELSTYDFVVGAGNDEAYFSFPWPETSSKDVARKVPEAIQRSEEYFKS